MTARSRIRLRHALRRLRANRSGLALTEFAFSLPVLLALGLYGFETANLAIGNLRVSNIATLTADNAARVRDSIDEADVVHLLTGAKMTGTGIRFAANGRVILTVLEPTSDGAAQWIRWQRCDGALNVASSYGQPRTILGTTITDGTEMLGIGRILPSLTPSSQQHSSARLGPVGPAGRQIMAQPGAAVMLVEVVYNYQPVVGNWVFGPVQLRYESAFNVRQRTDQALKNANRIAPKSCNIFQQ